jgi:hypothetical protein
VTTKKSTDPSESGVDFREPFAGSGRGWRGVFKITQRSVVGPNALPLDPPSGAKFRTSHFVTVADVADFVTKTMPPKAPGSHSTEDYFSVLAFDLKANGIDLGDKKLDAALAASLTIPRK